MNKLIAVWGSPGAGKTTTSVKLALTIANMGYNTILVSPDQITPSVPVLFPIEATKKYAGLSIGKVLDSPDIVQNDVLMQIIAFDKKVPLGILGYNFGENEKTYPDFEQSKHSELILQVSQLADYVIVDCMSNAINKTTAAALQQSDAIIQIYKPEIRSEVFFNANKPIVESSYLRYDNMISVIRTGINAKQQVINDISSVAKAEHIIPYSMELVNQYEAGAMLQSMGDNAYSKSITTLAETLILQKEEGAKDEVKRKWFNRKQRSS